MEKEYDVVVAGAGPAGAQAARDLAKRDYEVAVLETESEEEYPSRSNKSTAGTFPRMISRFGVPDDVIMHYTDSVVLESPNEFYEIEAPGAVLDFGDFKQFLVEDGMENGAEYFFSSRVFEPVFDEGGSPAGVRYNSDQEVYGDIMIDATGPAAPIAQHEDVGIVDLERDNQAIGIEYELEELDVDAEGFADLSEAMMLRLDHEVAPGGYSWVFHTGEDTAKVGVCYIRNDQHRRHSDGRSIDEYLQDWLVDDPRFDEESRDEIDPLEVHRGSAHIQKPDSVSSDSVMAVGDTVSSVDPLWGEGIDTGMRSGRMAALTADEALSPSKLGKGVDTSSDALSSYDDRWESEVAPNRSERQLLTEMMYNLDNDRYDTLMQDLQETSLDDLASLNEGKLREMRHLLHLEDIKPAARFGWQKAKQKSPALRKAEEWIKEELQN
jgi:digeranylgeranylglycerophospholipid reductase